MPQARRARETRRWARVREKGGGVVPPGRAIGGWRAGRGVPAAVCTRVRVAWFAPAAGRGTATRGTRRAGVAEARAREARVGRVPRGEAGAKRRTGTAEADSANAMFAGGAGESVDATLEGSGRRARCAMGSRRPVRPRVRAGGERRSPTGAVTSTGERAGFFFAVVGRILSCMGAKGARARGTHPSRAAPGTDDVASHGRGHSDAPHTATDAHAPPSRNGAVPPWTRVARHRRSRPPLAPRPATLDDGVARRARRRSPTPRRRRVRRLVPRREPRVPPSRGRLLGRRRSPRRAHPRRG